MIESKRRNTSDKMGISSTRYLTRILIYLSEVKYDTYTNIYKKLGLESRKVNDALNWLTSHKLIDKKMINDRINHCDMYSMNKQYFKLWNDK